MRRHWQWIALTVVVVALAAVLARRLAAGHRAAADDDDSDISVAMPSRVSIENGEPVLTLDAKTQAAINVGAAALKATTAAAQTVAPATVVGAQPLVAARAQYVATQSALAQDQAAVAVAQQEAARLQRLYRNQQNVALKAVQAAAGTVRADRAKIAGEQQSLGLQLAAVRQDWGPAVATWVEADAPQLEALFARKAVLVQVTLPGAASAAGATGTAAATTAPQRLTLTAPTGQAVAATLVGPYPHVDPRVQGLSQLYTAPAGEGLAPGLNLNAALPAGAGRRGVLVPQAAIVWWQGTAWAYVELSPTKFTRRAVPTARPLAGGLFAASGFKAGERVVVRGAEALLSEELRAQIQPED